MATPTPTPTPRPEPPVRLVPPTGEPATGPLAGEPGIVGLPSFIVGSLAFGLVLTGVLPTVAVGAAMPIVLAAAAGLFLATIWCARIGQNAQAGLYGIVASFFLSYAIMVLGLTHSWLGIVPTTVMASQKLFVICWMVIVTMLVLATLRLPVIYTALFALVDVALLLNLLGLSRAGEPDEGRRLARDEPSRLSPFTSSSARRPTPPAEGIPAGSPS